MPSCNVKDADSRSQCRRSIYQHILYSTNVNLYSSGFWTLTEGPNRTSCGNDNCQTSAVFYERNSKFFSYGIASANNDNVVVDRAPGENEYVAVAKRADNQGVRKEGVDFAVVAAYVRQSP